MDVPGRRHQLRKLSEAAPPEESLGQVLETLWSTRATGLAPHQKPTVQCLLNLASVRDLEPVLACLRSIIRRTLKDKLCDDNIRMLFPVDISEELQSNLVLLLNKYRNRWKEEASRDQGLCLPLSQQIRQDSMMDPSAMTSTQASNSSLVLSSQSDSSTVHCNSNHIEECADLNIPQMTSIPPQKAVKVVLPELKSMTWMVENRTAVPTNRVAVINLKLQDNTKCPCGEKEIKFCLSKDTLEAMLRSMTYIREQLSKYTTLASQTTKRQKQ